MRKAARTAETKSRCHPRKNIQASSSALGPNYACNDLWSDPHPHQPVPGLGGCGTGNAGGTVPWNGSAAERVLRTFRQAAERVLPLLWFWYVLVYRVLVYKVLVYKVLLYRVLVYRV